jgi:hypothetical protein
MTQAGQLLHFTDTFNITATAPVPLHYGMKNDTQGLEQFCVRGHM